MYPWALLVVLQFVMPHISFLGHLSGILLGTLQLHGAMDIFLPTDAYLQHLESLSTLETITSKPGFIRMPEMGSPLRGGEIGGLIAAVVGGLGVLKQLVINIFETIKFCIFGGGTEANGNIQLLGLPGVWRSTQNSAIGAGVQDVDELYDDESAGLPTIERRERSGLL